VARKPQGELARKLAARAYEGHSALADLAAEAGQVDRADPLTRAHAAWVAW
jgi:hypothetical protein